MPMLPPAKPALTPAALKARLKAAGHVIDREKYPIVVVGIRGYYRDTMGEKGKNDRGIYDDAVFLDTPNGMMAYNANVDPSVFRPGIATLVPGLYYAHLFDLHRGQYLALCQRAAMVPVQRDGGKLDMGWHGINIHRGSNTTTSSLGCTTIPPKQWDSFITVSSSEAQRIVGRGWKKLVVPYALLLEPGA